MTATERHDTVTWPHPYENEYTAMLKLFAAVSVFRAAIKECGLRSDMQRDQMRYLDDAVIDNLPSQAEWREKIAAAMMELKP